MTPKAFFTAFAGGSLFAVALAAGATPAVPSDAATPPPTPPPLNTPATPQPAATLPAAPESTPIPLPSGYGFPVPASAAPGTHATPSPPANSRKGLEGVWEVQIQQGSKTNYAHFNIAQTGSTITGTYLNDAGKRYPLVGTVDGEAIRLVVSMPDGTSLVMQGRLDGTTDMIGMLTMANQEIPFTAAYREKEKWIDNLNAAPGGLGTGTGGGYTPPR